MASMKTPGKAGAVLLAALVLALAAYLLTGRYPSAGITDPGLFFRDDIARGVLLSIRLPRALGAILLGAVLGASGAAFQTIFGNPLVDAGFLGVSQGAAFGAAIALAAGLGRPGRGFLPESAVGALSFAMAIAALWASIALSRRFRFGGQVLRLLLAGLAVSAFFSALLAAVKYAADPLSQLPDIVFWTMGSLASMTWPRLWSVAPFALLSLVALFTLRWRATLLSLDDEVSVGLGLKPDFERSAVAVAGAVGVAAVTAACGVVAWVGLVVPQVIRMLAGPDGRRSIPLSMAGGAVFVLIADGLARSLFPGELPLGILTALLGVLLFIPVLSSRKTELAR